MGAVATRERLRSAALSLFVEQGVAETTTRDLAARAGIAEGTIFRVVDSKEELVEAAICRAFEPGALVERIAEIDADLPLEFHEPPASPDPSSGASNSTLSTPSSSPLSSPSTSPGSSPGRSEWTSNPPTPSFEINADDEKNCFILYADDGVEECPATPPRTGRRLAKSSPPRLFPVG